MKIVVNQNIKVPIYKQIQDQIREQISCGAAKEGEKLPSLRALAKDLNVSIITTKNAYRILEEEGVIYSRAGKGYFVGEPEIYQLDRREIIMKIGDVVRSKITGHLYKVVAQRPGRCGFTCERLNEDLPENRYYLFDDEVDVISGKDLGDLNEDYRTNKFTIRMDVTMDKEMTFEEAEKAIFDALRSAGMKANCGVR